MSTRITVLQSKSEVKGQREKDKLHYAVRKRSLLTALSEEPSDTLSVIYGVP